MRTDPQTDGPGSGRVRQGRAVIDRDRGLLRIARVNRWTIGGAIAMTGFLSTVAALAHPGSSHRATQASSGAATQAPAGTASGTANGDDAGAGSSSSDPAAGYVDPNAGADGQSAVPSDPSQAVPSAPSSPPQAIPDAGGPPAATSGGS